MPKIAINVIDTLKSPLTQCTQEVHKKSQKNKPQVKQKLARTRLIEKGFSSQCMQDTHKKTLRP